MKKCVVCKVERDVDLFYATKSTKDGLATMCKDCDNARKTAYMRRKSKEAGKNIHINTLDSRELKAAGLKHCPGCKKALSFDEFSTGGTSNEFASRCKQCANIAARKRSDREDVKAAARAKYVENKKRIRDDRLRAKFGISLAEYNEKLALQMGICPGCGMTPEENCKDLAVDHNHITGKIRGLLCGKCNAALGFMNDNKRICENLIQYLNIWEP